MKTIITNNPQNTIRQLKCHMEAGQMRLTFLWPIDCGQVYVFKTETRFDIAEADPNRGRLFTLQEYKKQGGYIEPRPSGAFVYSVFPFIREGGEDFAIIYKGGGSKGGSSGESGSNESGSNEGSSNEIEVTGQIPIDFSVTEKTGFLSKEKKYTVTLLSQQAVEGDVLCYVKKEGSYPQNPEDGVMYFFGDGLAAGIKGRWEIKVKKNDYIRIFVRDQDKASIYLLKPEVR